MTMTTTTSAATAATAVRRANAATAAAPGDGLAPRPWWTVGYVWLIITGPLVVVLAGLGTAWLAWSRPDPVVAKDYYRQGIEINQRLAAGKAALPAQQGRNHAATPAQALPAQR